MIRRKRVENDMKQYRTRQVITLGGGVLALTPEQAKSRAAQVRSTADEGCYEALVPVQFIAGEVFGYDGEMPPALADAVEVIDYPEPSSPESLTDSGAGSESAHGSDSVAEPPSSGSRRPRSGGA